MKDVLLNHLTPPDVSPDALGGLTFFAKGRCVTWKGQALRLSKGEYAILRRLALDSGDFVLRDELEGVREIIGLKNHERGVDSTIKRLRTKFTAVDPNFDAIRVAYKIGYAWIPNSRIQDKAEQDTPASEFLPPHRLVVDKEAYRATLHGRPLRLTPSGIALVAEMAFRPGYFLDHEEISRVCAMAPHVAGTDPSQAARSLVSKVRSHVRRAFPGVEIFQTAYGIGVRLHPDIEPSLDVITRRSDG